MKNLDHWRENHSIPRSFFDDMWGVLDGFDRMGTAALNQNHTSGHRFTSPACDVAETQDHYVLSVDAPGLKKDDINIELIGRQLTISGERKFEESKEDTNTYRRERLFGKFSRVFELPEGVNSDLVEASYENGVLRVNVPKAETAKPKKIQITEGGKGFLKKLTHKSEARAINA